MASESFDSGEESDESDIDDELNTARLDESCMSDKDFEKYPVGNVGDC